jgi:hypothetical protein
MIYLLFDFFVTDLFIDLCNDRVIDWFIAVIYLMQSSHEMWHRERDDHETVRVC